MKMVFSRTLLAAAATLLCFTQIVEAGVAKRSTTTSPPTGNQLQEALTSAQQAVSNAASNVSQALGLNNLPQPETVASSLHNQTLSFARTLGNFVGQLHNEVSSHQSNFSSLLQSAVDKVNETVTNIQNENPQVTKSAEEAKTSFNSFLQSWIQEAQKIVSQISPESQAAQIVRTVLDRTQETANEFKNSVQAATQSQPAQ